jgi:hypothetical protein
VGTQQPLESATLRMEVDALREEISRISEPMMRHLKNPLPRVTPDGGSLQDEIREAFMVPGWQPFRIGGCRIDVPTAVADAAAWRAHVRERCLDLDVDLQEQVFAGLDELRNQKSNTFDQVATLLSLAPTPDVIHYQFDWWRLHCPKLAAQEFERVVAVIKEALADRDSLIAGLFLAFNFRMLLVSTINCRVNDSRYYEVGAPSPFVYMMV